MIELIEKRRLIRAFPNWALLILLLLSACGGSANGANAETDTSLEVLANTQADESNLPAEEGPSDNNEENVAADSEGANSQAENNEAPADDSVAVLSRVAPEISLGEPQMKSSPAGVFNRATGQIQVLEFFAYWCPNCKALAPRIHGLEAAYEGEIEFTFLDIDNPANQALKDEFGFYYQPFVLVIDGNGNVHMTWVGGGINPLDVQAEIERLIELQG